MKYKIKEAIPDYWESPLLLGGYGLLLISENQSVVSGTGIHCNRLAAVYFLSQQLLRQIVQQIVLYGTFHRTGTEFRVIPCIGKEVYGGICQNQFHTVTGKHLLHTLDLEHHNLLDFGLCQWQEHDGFVDTVQEFRADGLFSIFITSFWFPLRFAPYCYC